MRCGRLQDAFPAGYGESTHPDALSTSRAPCGHIMADAPRTGVRSPSWGSARRGSGLVDPPEPQAGCPAVYVRRRRLQDAYPAGNGESTHPDAYGASLALCGRVMADAPRTGVRSQILSLLLRWCRASAGRAGDLWVVPAPPNADFAPGAHYRMFRS
ncbi:hypothetical protein NDU88_006522 [Pleurodeles waltl]|uniref:Uncharacterized protein n=1 Tax=Pleurodeles waltl TaxID=8319 RepID=A0AAV7UN87_PLEWA|nr:hypothetical protein NDU88_006522 [Pleurodeles waltl]